MMGLLAAGGESARGSLQLIWRDLTPGEKLLSLKWCARLRGLCEDELAASNRSAPLADAGVGLLDELANRARALISLCAEVDGELAPEEQPLLREDLEWELSAALFVHQRVIARSVEELRTLSDALRKIASASPEILLAIAMRAVHGTSVLVLGDTGTGKENAARAIHELSARSRRPFVVANVGGLTAELAESELFGHVKGGFTGATRKKLGMFREADGGTLFLDEIGDVPPKVQVQLLRALDPFDASVRPIGEEQAVKVDVRVIFATNRDLNSMSKKGLLRTDLYHRIANAGNLNLLPLRERTESDFRAIWDANVARFAEAAAMSLPALDDRAMKRLREHHWPGNVRELQSWVAEYVNFNIGRTVPMTVEEFLGWWREQSPRATPSAEDATGDTPDADWAAVASDVVGLARRVGLEKVEEQLHRHVLQQAVEEAGSGNAAAVMLKLSYGAFYKRCERAGLRLRRPAGAHGARRPRGGGEPP